MLPPTRVTTTLRRDHPCATTFLDESGAIARDRFFAVGLLRLPEPSRLLRAVQKWRDVHHWYQELKFADVTRGAVGLYKQVADLCLGQGDETNFFCFVADRDTSDPIARWGTQWDAYGKLAEQLVLAAIRPPEIITVLADNYSTPDHILFEENLRANVNRRLKRLAVASVCRLDSRSSDGLQLADLLTSATAYEFRQAHGLAGSTGPKHELASHVRQLMGTTSCLAGHRNGRHSVAIYAEKTTVQTPRVDMGEEQPIEMAAVDNQPTDATL